MTAQTLPDARNARSESAFAFAEIACSALRIAALSVASMSAMLCSTFTPARAAELLPRISDKAHLTDQQIRNYASSLVQIEQIQSALASKSAGIPADKSAILESEAAAHIEQILSRHELDVATFNELSRRVDRSPLLRQQVQQFAMQEKIGF